MKALLISADGETTDLDVPESGHLGWLQGHVGGYIEFVDLGLAGSLVVNEEGKLHGLPRNRLATWLASPRLWGGDYIAGAAVLVGPVDDNGDFTSAPFETVEVAKRMEVVAGSLD